MSDSFHPIDPAQLLSIALTGLRRKDSYFGIPASLFYTPPPPAGNPLGSTLFGRYLATPLGVAAGPHTQMAQNIVAAWLMGARYIELKTVQTLDRLDVPKPCIDMYDEGYNCEWSQELRIQESFREYLHAWVIIHVINHFMGWDRRHGTLFNMSVGYNLDGIRQDNMQWFFRKMDDCSGELQACKEALKTVYPKIHDVAIPTRISDNVTLSTMHGCPADEIETIARYLIAEKGLHTYVKLNPTLLGPATLRDILNRQLGFDTVVPDQAFEHDLKYSDAVAMIARLRDFAGSHGLKFGLKLTNTLESENHRKVFPSGVDMMYMSGRALHPLAIALAARLQQDFGGRLDLSFSAGADAFNIADTMACGFKTVTVCSDLLRPGGYMRLKQYIDALTSPSLSTYADLTQVRTMQSDTPETHLTGVQPEELSGDDVGSAQTHHTKTAKTEKGADGAARTHSTEEMAAETALARLQAYAVAVTASATYRRKALQPPDIKTKRPLGVFDCIAAPCRDTCATGQDIPDYMYFAARGEFGRAFDVVLRTNPFPRVTGMVCDHLCQNKCTRLNYDSPLLIREVKRFVAEHGTVQGAGQAMPQAPRSPNGLSVSVVGAGPAGLSCAWFLALAGFTVDVYEQHERAGGMVHYAIPGFRLTADALDEDLRRIEALGVRLHYGQRVDVEMFRVLRERSHYVFVGAGAQLPVRLDIAGIDAAGVRDALQLLREVKQGRRPQIGPRVLIVGGGNTAMDTARTASRLIDEGGSVTVVYRRTIREMPADQGEVRAVLDEGVGVMELTAPEAVVVRNGRVVALRCVRMRLGEAGSDGRPRPEKIPDSSFDILCNTLIPAVGQRTDIPFVDVGDIPAADGSYMTPLDRVFTGGDALRGASTAINAIGDGRRAASEIMQHAAMNHQMPLPAGRKPLSYDELMLKRALRLFGAKPHELPATDRRHFRLVQHTLSEEETVHEAGRCLYCDELCNICTTVCPNLANQAYTTSPRRWQLYKVKRRSHRDDNSASYSLSYDSEFVVEQGIQIVNMANFCNACGNCNTFCPSAGAPYKDKPQLYLTAASFAGAETGYYIDSVAGGLRISCREHGILSTLLMTGEDAEAEYVYESPDARIRLDAESFLVKDAAFLSEAAEQVDLRQAATMAVVLRGLEMTGGW